MAACNTTQVAFPASKTPQSCNRLTRMDFSVAFNKDDVRSYADSSRYEIHDFGVLVVTDETGKRLHVSPVGWLWVEDQEPKSAHARMTKNPT